MYKRTAVTITDNHTDNTATIQAPITTPEIEEAIAPWFDESMAAAVAGLAEAIAEHKPLDAHEAELGVTVETRTTWNELADVQEAARELASAAAELERATAARDEVIKRAVAAGTPATDVARAAGLARSRLYQII